VSRVLLFVQSGDARPKCVKSFGDRRRNAAAYFTAIEKRFGQEGQPDRAWLVACANADEGRMIIGCCPLDDHRILASGGKEATR